MYILESGTECNCLCVLLTFSAVYEWHSKKACVNIAIWEQGERNGFTNACKRVFTAGLWFILLPDMRRHYLWRNKILPASGVHACISVCVRNICSHLLPGTSVIRDRRRHLDVVVFFRLSVKHPQTTAWRPNFLVYLLKVPIKSRFSPVHFMWVIFQLLDRQMCYCKTVILPLVSVNFYPCLYLNMLKT